MARSGQTVMGHHPVLREAYPHGPPCVEHKVCGLTFRQMRVSLKSLVRNLRPHAGFCPSGGSFALGLSSISTAVRL